VAVTDDQARQIVAAQANAQGALMAAAVAAAGDAYRTFTDWYDSAAIGALSRHVVAVVQAAQRQSAALTEAYLVHMATAVTDRAPRGSGQIVRIEDLRKDADPVQVYGRPADTYRYALSEGRTPPEARAQAVQRAEVLADTDVALAMRAQARRFMVVHRVDGFRRVIHPELSRGGSCGLCVGASDRIYHREALMPLHARCKCTVAPIINGVDPGHSLNRADLDRLYKEAGGTQARHLASVRWVVHEDGELGPILTEEGQHFRGPAEVARDLQHAS
jgi:hypothetical protein